MSAEVGEKLPIGCAELHGLSQRAHVPSHQGELASWFAQLDVSSSQGMVTV